MGGEPGGCPNNPGEYVENLPVTGMQKRDGLKSLLEENKQDVVMDSKWL